MKLDRSARPAVTYPTPATKPTPPSSRRITRRTFLGAALTVSGAALLAACGQSAPATPTTAPKPADAKPAATTAPPPVAVGGQPSPSPAASPAAGASPAAAASPAAGAPPASPVASPASSPSPAAQRAPVAPGRTVEITFSHIWATPPNATAAQRHPAEQVADAFNASSGANSSGVKVVTRVDSTDYYEIFQKAQADMAAGKPPALVMIPWASILFADASLGITNLDDIAPPGELDQTLATMNPAAVALVKLDGKVKGMPYALSCPVLYYNADFMKQVGVDPAVMFKDWTAFAEHAPTLKGASGGPIIGLGGNWDWPAQSLIQNAGGRVLNDQNVPSMDSSEAAGAMKIMADLGKADLLSLATPRENTAAFQGGSMPLFMNSIASLGGLRGGVQFNLGTHPFPLYPGRPRRMSSGGSFIACFARDREQQAAAWEFIRFAASQAGTEIWMKTGYLNATSFSVPIVPGQEAAYTQYNEGLTRETAWPGRRGGEAQRVWATYVQRIWANDLQVEDGLKQAKSEVQTLISQG